MTITTDKHWINDIFSTSKPRLLLKLKIIVLSGTRTEDVVEFRRLTKNRNILLKDEVNIVSIVWSVFLEGTYVSMSLRVMSLSHSSPSRFILAHISCFSFINFQDMFMAIIFEIKEMKMLVLCHIWYSKLTLTIWAITEPN